MIAMVLLFTLVYFIAGYIVTLYDVAYRPPAQEHSAPAPAPAGYAIPNPARLDLKKSNPVQPY